MALTAEEIDGKPVKSLKTLVAKQIAVPRFRQRWLSMLSEDHSELSEDACVIPSDVQVVILDFVQAEDREVQKLLDACRWNQLDQVDELLRKPLDPDVVDNEGQTTLHLAAQSGHVHCLALLLEAGADTNKVSFEGRTALHDAASRGHVEVTRRLLLEAGVDKNAVDSGGRTALHCASESERFRFQFGTKSYRDYPQILRRLLEAGFDKDATTSDGRTALHLAACKGHPGIVRELLKDGAKIDVPDLDGTTALHCAARRGSPDVIWLLLEAGADKDAADSQGKTALDWACALDWKVVKLLKR